MPDGPATVTLLGCRIILPTIEADVGNNPWPLWLPFVYTVYRVLIYNRFWQNGRGIMTVLAKAAKIRYKLGRDKRYKRMGAKGARGHYRRLPRRWER